MNKNTSKDILQVAFSFFLIKIDFIILKYYKVVAIIFITLITIIVLAIGTVDFNEVMGSATQINSIIPFSYPTSLNNYIENGFIDTNIPSHSPFGGQGMEYTEITALYHDGKYFKEFGAVHNGIDLIPSSTYYVRSEAYKKYNQSSVARKRVPILATMSGRACSSGSLNKGYKIEIYSNNNIYKTLYLHNEVNFFPINSCINVKAGEPIGIMGQTGKATGLHSHYMVFIIDSTLQWKDINPYSFLIF